MADRDKTQEQQNKTITPAENASIRRVPVGTFSSLNNTPSPTRKDATRIGKEITSASSELELRRKQESKRLSVLNRLFSVHSTILHLSLSPSLPDTERENFKKWLSIGDKANGFDKSPDVTLGVINKILTNQNEEITSLTLEKIEKKIDLYEKYLQPYKEIEGRSSLKTLSEQILSGDKSTTVVNPFNTIAKQTTESEHVSSNEQRLRAGMTVTLVNNETGKHEPWLLETIRKENRGGKIVWVGDIVNQLTQEKKTQAMEGLEVFSQEMERASPVITTSQKQSVLRPVSPEKKINNMPVGDIISLFNKKESEPEELLSGFVAWEKKWLENSAIDRFREKNKTLTISPQQIESTKKLLTAYRKIIKKSISDTVPSSTLGTIKQNVIILVRILTGVNGKESEDIEYLVKNYTEQGDSAWLSRLEDSLEKIEAPTPSTQQKKDETPIEPVPLPDKKTEPETEPQFNEKPSTEHSEPDIYSTWPSYIHQQKDGSRTIWISSRNKGKRVELANPDVWSKEKDASKQVFSSYLNFIMNGTPEERKTKTTLFSDLIALKNQYIALLGNEKLDAAEVMREQFRRTLEESQKKWSATKEEENIVPILEKKYNAINDEFTIQKNRCKEIKSLLSSTLEREMITKLQSRIEQENGKTYQKIKDGDITKEDENTLTQLLLLVNSFRERLDVLEKKNHAIYGKTSGILRSSAVSPAKDNWVVKKRDGTETTVKEWREEQLANEEKKIEDSHKSRIDSHLELLQRHREMFKRDPETYKKLYENKLYVKGDVTQDVVNEVLNRLDGGLSQDTIRAQEEAKEKEFHDTLSATKETYSPASDTANKTEESGVRWRVSQSEEDKKGTPKETVLKQSAESSKVLDAIPEDKKSELKESIFADGMVNATNVERGVPHWTKNSQEKTQEEKEKKITAVAKLLEILEKGRVKEWWAYAFVKSPKNNPFAKPEMPREQAPKGWRDRLKNIGGLRGTH